MDLQQQTFLPEQDCKASPVYRGGSLASRIAVQASVKRLLMSVISGRSSGELLAKLSPDGLWLKTCQGSFQAKMDGSLETYSGTLPRWGLMLDGELILPQRLEPYIDENEWRLLPTPTASCGIAWKKVNRTNVTKSLHKNLTIPKRGRGLMQNRLIYYLQATGHSAPDAAQVYETTMGYPKGWTG